jgi:hypothetical protein
MLQEPLPAGHCLRSWYQARQTSALQNRACDPDRLRSTDSAEGVRHYLEIDWVTPAASYPREWSIAMAQLRQFATRNGIVPWRVEEQYEALVAAFRTKDPSQILDQTFFMSHYVTDSFSVLHDTKNFNPNDGLHERWESDMLNSSANIDAISAATRTFYGTPGTIDPRNAIFDIVLVGNDLVSQLVAADVAAGGLDAGGGGYRRSVLFEQSRDLTARRWADALTVLASLIWMAWAEAGSTDLPGFEMGCSKTVPVTVAVLRGFPVPNGWTPKSTNDGGVLDAGSTSDGGSPVQVEDSGADAGLAAGGGDAGGRTPMMNIVDPNASVVPIRGCGCQGTFSSALVWLCGFSLCAARRRR